MKKLIVMTILAVFAVGSVMAQNDSVQADGQKKGGFGSAIKKFGEKTTGVNMTNEPFIVNPLKSAVDVEFVGAYGDAVTGYVSLVFKVKNKTYEKKVSCGASIGGNGATAAFDTKGKTYKPYSSNAVTVDAPKDIWVEVRLEGQFKGGFKDVPETLAAFELINVSCYVNAGNRGLIEFRNIPIQWGVVPE